MRLELGRTLTHHWKVAFMLLTFLSSPVKYTALSLQRHTYEQSYNGKRGKSCSIFTRTGGTTPLIHH